MTAGEDTDALLEQLDWLTDEPGGDKDSGPPDRRDGRVYLTSPELRMALKLALVTRRPLLLRGEPGSGKSSLAAYVARNLGWRYYEHVITSRTQARDLLWSYDTVRRFADAAGQREELFNFDYVEPGVLWWVMNPRTAKRRGAPPGRDPEREAVDPGEDVDWKRQERHAVVLLDEIDKADPDVPNALLVPLGSTQFEVSETETLVTPDADEPARMLAIVTTNDERELPDAFVRRCVVHRLKHPEPDDLVAIARAHVAALGEDLNPDEVEATGKIARRVAEMRKQILTLGKQPPSTAEFLDAVFASRMLNLGADDWDLVEQLVLDKERLRTSLGQDEQDEGAVAP
jgi:MoxR-like ATPase